MAIPDFQVFTVLIPCQAVGIVVGPGGYEQSRKRDDVTRGCLSHGFDLTFGDLRLVTGLR